MDSTLLDYQLEALDALTDGPRNTVYWFDAETGEESSIRLYNYRQTMEEKNVENEMLKSLLWELRAYALRRAELPQDLRDRLYDVLTKPMIYGDK